MSLEVKQTAGHLISNLPRYFVSREQWGALPRQNRGKRMIHPATTVVVTFNMATEKCMTREQCVDVLQDLQRKCIREDGLDDIQYNFLIGGDGTLYEGRGWYFQPCNYLPYRSLLKERIDIAYIGDYTDGDRSDLCEPVMDLVEHGIVNKFVTQDYSLMEHPETELAYKDAPDEIKI